MTDETTPAESQTDPSVPEPEAPSYQSAEAAEAVEAEAPKPAAPEAAEAEAPKPVAPEAPAEPVEAEAPKPAAPEAPAEEAAAEPVEAEAPKPAAPEAPAEEAAAEPVEAEAPKPAAPEAAEAEAPKPAAPEAPAEPVEAETPKPAAPEAAEAEAPKPAAPEAPAEEAATEPVAEAPQPAVPRPPVPKPGPVPTPAAVKKAAHPPAAPVLPSPTPGPAAETFGRVDDAGVVFVRTAEGEREVGSYPGASAEEALHYFARKYDELFASAELLHQRVTGTDISARDAADGLAKLKEHTTEPNVVGDLEALARRVTEIETAVEARKESEAAERSASREASRKEREALVAEAEAIAGQPEQKIQWKSSGARMRALLDEWKKHQRSGARLDRETETALWQRFSHARNSFDKARRVHFAQLEGTQAEAKAAKEELVREAEALAGSKDWGSTAGAFKRLMDRWRKAGRASRADDDALWERFKTAQDTFFAAKDEIAAAEDEEFRANLAVKETLLQEAQGILPITDIEDAKAALRNIQDKWDKAGKVPRGDVDRMEKGLRRIESAVREADEKRWATVNPEAAARAQSMVDQLEASVSGLREDLTKAEASGNEKKVADARAALEAQEQWLAQARAGLDEFGG